MRIGLLGFGTIGRFLAEKITSTHGLELAFIVDPYANIASGTPYEVKKELIESDLSSVDLMVEAANMNVVKAHAELILQHCDFLVFSLCAFSDEEFQRKIEKLCLQTGKKFFIPHGAILGLDGIFDGRDLFTDVSITTIKKPKGLGVACTEKTILFEGLSRDACKKFPNNVNVHAAVSLAGIGFDRTKSLIIADPDIPGNTHIIALKGEGIDFEIRISSVPKGLVSGVYTPFSAFGSVLRLARLERVSRTV
jgi:aspartate dehydrogenase